MYTYLRGCWFITVCALSPISIQAFILSNECGEILEEELDGEGDNEVMIYDERGPEPSPVSIRIDLPPSPPSIQSEFLCSPYSGMMV